jgi:hypothetical protein
VIFSPLEEGLMKLRLLKLKTPTFKTVNLKFGQTTLNLPLACTRIVKNNYRITFTVTHIRVSLVSGVKSVIKHFQDKTHFMQGT